LGIGILKTNAGIGIPAFVISVRYRSKKMPDCIILFRYRIGSGIVSLSQSGTGLTGCRTFRHSGISIAVVSIAVVSTAVVSISFAVVSIAVVSMAVVSMAVVSIAVVSIAVVSIAVVSIAVVSIAAVSIAEPHHVMRL
jgi:hypothetical protein